MIEGQMKSDVVNFRQWLEKLAVQCEDLKSSVRSNSERFTNRQSSLEQEFERLSHAAEERRRQLENAVHLYQYLRESQELEAWINEQLQVAMSEDYGNDYEHLKVGVSAVVIGNVSCDIYCDSFLLYQDSEKFCEIFFIFFLSC